MIYKINVTPKAFSDITDACNYYESAQTGLSSKFLSALADVYEKIGTSPQLYSFLSSKKDTSLRDIKIKRFPFLVVFDYSDNIVTVYAVFNSHRNSKF